MLRRTSHPTKFSHALICAQCAAVPARPYPYTESREGIQCESLYNFSLRFLFPFFVRKIEAKKHTVLQPTKRENKHREEKAKVERSSLATVPVHRPAIMSLSTNRPTSKDSRASPIQEEWSFLSFCLQVYIKKKLSCLEDGKGEGKKKADGASPIPSSTAAHICGIEWRWGCQQEEYMRLTKDGVLFPAQRAQTLHLASRFFTFTLDFCSTS